jgi:hypothetical protein
MSTPTRFSSAVHGKAKPHLFEVVEVEGKSYFLVDNEVYRMRVWPERDYERRKFERVKNDFPEGMRMPFV